jgi:hypothetical protein
MHPPAARDTATRLFVHTLIALQFGHGREAVEKPGAP